MNAIDRYFDKIYCINLDRSPERWAHAQEEMRKHGITRMERFRGYDFHEWDHLPPHLRIAMHSGMCGCSHSHAAILHTTALMGWDKVLVLEDDFEMFHDNFNERFAAYMAEVPEDWDIVYLGAHYGYVPTERISEHVVKATYIKTTSSYAIRGKHARIMAPILGSPNGPDDTLSGQNPLVNAYVLHPRLMGQFRCLSAIWGHVTENSMSMSDPPHESQVEALPITLRK